MKLSTLEQLASDTQIRKEYRKTFLLNIFKKLCVRMNRSSELKSKIRRLYRQSVNSAEITRIIVKRQFNYELDSDETNIMKDWILAYLKKSNMRKRISSKVKKELYEKQNGKCMICKEELGIDWSKIHVDHIIPWILVGDELKDNFQVLCDLCNQSKSARTDYIFNNLINLT